MMDGKRLRKALAATALCVLLAVATGCKQDSEAPTPGDNEEQAQGKTIGFSIFDMQYTFFQDMEAGTRDACEEMGYEYLLHDQKSDPAQMVAGCEGFLTRGVDALIISPFEPSALGPVVSKAKAQGIPVVINDIGGGGTSYDAIVISDCYGGGAMAADYMAEQLAQRENASKKVGVLKCNPGHVYAIRRGEGFTDRIKELGYEVVATLCADDQRAKGYEVAKDMMTRNPEIAGIFCENDPMAVGAVEAIRDAGKSPIDDILVVGFNGDPEALEAIKAGYMAATIQQVPYEMGVKCVELVDKLLKGEELEYTDPELREITVPVRLITSENIDEAAGSEEAAGAEI